MKRKKINREKSAQRAASRIRALIIANDLRFFWTLTYKENVIDVEEVNRDFNLFIKRLEYKLRKKLDYVAVKEVQEERQKKYGHAVWHIHLALNVYVDKDLLEKTWGKGFTFVTKFGPGENYSIEELAKCASYLAKYIKKDLDKYYMEGKKRYFCSQKLKEPKKYQILLSEEEIEDIKNKSNIDLDFDIFEWLQVKDEKLMEDLKDYNDMKFSKENKEIVNEYPF